VSWQHIRGHDFWVRSFADAIKRGRLAHAYLFAGPAGIGKKLFAFELAKTLLCESPKKPFVACDKCPSCLQVSAGTHPDVIFASRPEDKVDFPIDTMREVMEKLALKPARGGYKVAIIDDADDFNSESANCFLKTLEEPPPNSLLILIAADAERQLPTVLSRCQVVRFAPVPIPDVAAFLQEHEIDAIKAERLARIGGGSPGQALELSDSDLWNFRKDFINELAKAKPDSVALAKKWLAFNEEAGTEGGMQRRRAALMLRLILEFLEDVLRASTGASLTDVDLEDHPAVEALARRLGTDRVVKLMDRSLDANYQIDRKVQLVLIIEALVDALTNAG
jgi:DNA polymerase-3 subunit delta'